MKSIAVMALLGEISAIHLSQGLHNNMQQRFVDGDFNDIDYDGVGTPSVLEESESLAKK